MNIQDEARRNGLIAEIRDEFSQTASYTGLPRLDEKVEEALKAMATEEEAPEVESEGEG